MSDLLREFERVLRLGAGTEGGTSMTPLLALMSSDRAAQLRRCAIPHEFNPAVLRAMTPELADTAATGYEELAEFSCFVPVPEGLALHDSVRAELFAEWLKPDHAEEFRAINARLAAHYESLLEAGNVASSEANAHRRMFHLLGAHQDTGFAEFEALCRQARHQRRLTACANLVRLVHEYDAVLTAPRAAWLTYHEAKLASDVADWERAERLFRTLVDGDPVPPALSVKVNLRLGYLAFVKRDFATAIDRYDTALRTVQMSDNSATRSYDIVRSLGEAYRDAGDLRKAEQLLTESLRDAQRAGDDAAIADTHNSLGTLYWRRSDITEAADAYQMSLHHLLRLGRTFQSAQVYNNLGMVLAERGDWGDAERAYGQSLEIKRQAGDTLGQARTLLNLVQVHRGRGDLGVAIATCRAAIELFEQIRHVSGLAAAKLTLGRIHIAQGAAGEAGKELMEAAELFTRIGDHANADATRREMAMIGSHERIPWWVWIPVGLAALVVIGLILLFVAAMAGWS